MSSKQGRRGVVSMVVAAAAMLTAVQVSAAEGQFEITRVQANVQRPPIVLWGAGLPSAPKLGDLRQISQPPRATRAAGRMATIDVFCGVHMPDAAPLADETVILYVDGRFKAQAQLRVGGRGYAYEMQALHVTMPMGSVPQLHQVQVIVQGTFSSQVSLSLSL